MGEVAVEVGEAVWNQTGMSAGNWSSVSLESNLIAADFVLESSKTLVRMSVMMSDDVNNDNGVYDSFSGVLSYAIYADDGGKPGALIATGTFANLQVVDAGRQESGTSYDTFVVSGDFAAPVDLGTGRFWFSIGENTYGSAGDGSPIWWERASTFYNPTYAAASKATPGTWTAAGTGNDMAFALFDNSSVTVAENTANATPQLIDTNARIVTTQTYNTGTLTVSGLLAEDRVSVIAGNGITVDGASISYNGAVIGSFTGGIGNSFVVTFANAPQAGVTALIQQLGYANVSDTPTATRTLYINAVDSSASGTPFVASPVTIKVTAEDDAAVATADSASGAENTAITGNVLTNDTDPDAALTTVSAVNGEAASVGVEITLPSGAKLTLNADGSYAYDPAGAFNLVATGTGAPTSTTDSFTYELSGGGSATVQITINGVDEADDERSGTVGDDTLTGSTGDDTFILNQSNDPTDNDTVDGDDGDDRFFMQDAFEADDALDGGDGSDTLLLQGDYNITLTGPMLTGIETIELMGGADNRFGTGSASQFTYVFTMDDSAVAAGERLTVDGSGLVSPEYVMFQGQNETDGSFAVYGGGGNDYLRGGWQGDFFAPGGGSDNLDAGNGVDAIYMGPNLDPTDYINGGASNDILGLQGDYSNYTFSISNATSIEVLALISGSITDYSGGTGAERYDYDLTTIDATVDGGQTLVVHAATLLAGEDLQFDGSAETDGNFFIYSGAGDDTLIGGAGNDTFVPSTGTDTLTGGGGNDLFYYRLTDESPASSPDSIADFTPGDHITVFGLGEPGGLGIRFIGEEGFSNRAGELRVTGSGTEWRVEIDVDGDGDSDFAIDVTTTVNDYGWSAADFIF